MSTLGCCWDGGMTKWLPSQLGDGSQRVAGGGSHSACYKWSTRGLSWDLPV